MVQTRPRSYLSLPLPEVNFFQVAIDLIRFCSLSLSADPEGPGCCALLLALVSILLIIATLPFSLCMCIKVGTNSL